MLTLRLVESYCCRLQRCFPSTSVPISVHCRTFGVTKSISADKNSIHRSNVQHFSLIKSNQDIPPLICADHGNYIQQRRCGYQKIQNRHLWIQTKTQISNQKLLGHYNHALLTSYRNINILSPKEILAVSPPFLQPYLRLIRFDKPIGSFLLWWPCSWSIGLATEAGHLPDLYIMSLFATGSFLMRGAGCIINDMWDKDFDKKVERTKLRPLASGELSMFQGLVCLAVNLSLSLAILLQLNLYSIILGASSMFLVISYPLAKRYTYWPQVMLGLTLNWGVLLSWAALRGSIEWPIILLYTACVLHTMTYDTIYSHQDKYDDMLIGVKSTALLMGHHTKLWLTGFGTMMVSGLTLTGYLCDQTWPYYTTVAAAAVHLAYQLYTVDLNNPDDCFAKFKSNSRLGFIIFVGIVLGTLLKPTVEKKSESEKAITAG
ncbi:hypothetical protein CHS0354_029633 [Potamilus streckersoni]|uniref:4-hydroxybenzoate polyprenyltransferase, mitochondrial n=1 Tax=Potamilus streckersoni TaxID=2493646 RepID=A0AAE0RTJ1_9BIVA|nr:hypothetical protein CHS0354_029633 [Potamilus streckersoni]